MTIRHSSVLRSALVNAPRETHGTGYSIYVVGANTRTAMLQVLAAVDRVYDGLLDQTKSAEEMVADALLELDDFIAR